jgi:hypothetical protein
MRTFAGRCLQHAGAEPLTAHFHQAKAGNTTNLNARAIMLQSFFHRTLDFAGVRMMLHIDEVDDDKACHIAQAQLTGDFPRRFQIG